ncbi:PITH domain-containing protein [Gigaspora rosea]|uniref:PITH domain-containing protein n=1 Tax=Gigaspora rosea TaxID=44941 RepID=A0A397VNA7_9GLOM|nr:PITH domain-containing protein [Gigaspora rosea]
MPKVKKFVKSNRNINIVLDHLPTAIDDLIDATEEISKTNDCATNVEGIGETIILIKEIIEIYENAQFNNKICNSLLDRAKSAEAAMSTLLRKKQENEEKFRSQAYYNNFMKFKTVLEKIKNFAGEVPQIRGISYINAYSIRDIELTRDYDQCMEDLRFTFVIAQDVQRRYDQESLVSNLEEMSEPNNRIEKNNKRCYTIVTKVMEYLDFIHNSSKLVTYEIASSASVVEEALVNAFPTFLFFKGGVEIERLVGADRTKMIKLLLKHIKIPRENEENDSNSLVCSLSAHKFNQNLNQQEEHIQSIFKNDDTCLESNDGAELIILIPFNQAIDLHSIKIVPIDIGQAPKEVKIFINRPNILSFDDAEAIRETQKLEFNPTDYKNNAIIRLRSVGFKKVTNIVLYIKNNIGDMDTTIIKELIFYG